MMVQIDNERFQAAHKAFLRHMLEQSDRIPFTNFQHPFLVRDEIEYKRIAYGKAKDVLQLDKWPHWVDRRPKRIIDATKSACDSKVSANLLYHSHGPESSSEAPLYRVRSESEIAGLAAQLYRFFKGGPSIPDAFDPRFDEFANYLRQHRLSCTWPFLAYLAFLLDTDRYFPIRPQRFDLLLQFYGTGVKISRDVRWERYALLLELADILKSKLALYGPATALEIQSYMWVISYLIKEKKVGKQPIVPTPDFDMALAQREQEARERERIGLRGEEFIYTQECARLNEAGRPDLMQRVRLVSLDATSTGYDILSFEPEGNELHIEVKTTKSAPDRDPGFWLTENERMQSVQDHHWCVYRVWSIDTSPSYRDLGNICEEPGDEWQLDPYTWRVTRKIAGDPAE
jgi:hypothetical protein